MYCSKCGAENDEGARFCGKCGQALTEAAEQAKAAEQPEAPAAAPPPPAAGVRVAQKTYAQEKNPVLALVLSLIIVGLGQFYNGDMKKGALMLVGGVICGAITLGLGWVGIAIWSAIDAHGVASGKTPLWT